MSKHSNNTCWKQPRQAFLLQPNYSRNKITHNNKFIFTYSEAEIKQGPILP